MGRALLARRDQDGQWAGGACFPADFRGDFSTGQPWTATLPTLSLLREFGIDPDAPVMRETIALVAANSRWEHAGQPFFEGEVEPCINGRTVAIGAYFGVGVDDIVDRLLAEQLGVALRRAPGPGLFRAVGCPPDLRLAEAIEVVRDKRQPDGRWLLENAHPGAEHLAMEDGDGQSSRWNTLRALWVLRWFDGANG